ncbi:ABC transporter substrate-binding protein [Ottowia sp.]|uniref:ABC transporter substrate-binding protein n=1 Tax=Ottowia sp. TaxID=1898956 RepID=UPI002CD2C653|nr:ABC transporter substrate-binding protein [Ottowia sp.]HOB66329.1 ABC transporter substrate-binding protein [Ottowia sp.]HPZ58407.1 ABC transporter substrate-binding protein [Ottowia sp.]HQD47401.1 ABC transporter substrate-binding protein [Ottowia sp.]
MKRKLLCTLIAGMGLAAAGVAQAQISGNVVKIGVMNDMSGVYADIGGPGSVLAAKMAVEDYLKASKSQLKVEVVSADHQNKPDVGSSIARKWYDSDGVDMIIDVPTSSVGLAINQVSKEKGKAYINTGSATSDLTGKDCSPNTVHWLYDTWMLAHGTGSAVVKNGGDSWYFLTADYAFGHALERDTSEVVKASGGKVLGSVKVPLATQDFSSFLLQAQSSKAKIIGLANAGGDTINSIKQAAEFGITKGGQKLAGLLVFLPDVHGLGLATAQGLNVTESWYWDLNDASRAWTKRFVAANGGKYPSSDHAGVYAGVLHYLKAVDAAKTDDGSKVIAKMKELPTDDPLFGKGSIRADGRKIHPVYLFEVKKPSESKGPYDYYKLQQTIPADKAFRPIGEGNCPLVAKK